MRPIAKRGSFKVFVFLATFLGFILYRGSTIVPPEPVEEPVKHVQPEPKKQIVVNKEYIKCLATNIYHEAGGEPLMGQIAVARVVMNRVKHGFANNPCNVVYQSKMVATGDNSDEYVKVCQFSWVCQGKTLPARNRTYIVAEEIATKVLTENAWKDDIPTNVLFFHNTSVNPGWAYRKTMTIGNHVFYSKH